MAARKTRLIFIADGKPLCPRRTCKADLSENGAINWPHPTFANLEVGERGKTTVHNMVGGDPDTKSVECSACGQLLDGRTWEW